MRGCGAPQPTTGRDLLGRSIGSRARSSLRRLERRGLAGVKLVISDAHEGIKAAVARVFRATWQRCRVGLLKNPFEVAVG
jgi:putative transposase